MRDEYIAVPAPAPAVPRGRVLIQLYPPSASTESLAMLSKIAEALGVEAGGHAALVALDEPASVVQQMSETDERDRPAFVVAYGFDPSELGAAWQVAPYGWIVHAGVAYCYVEAPDVILTDLDRKKRLWSSLTRVRAAAKGA